MRFIHRWLLLVAALLLVPSASAHAAECTYDPSLKKVSYAYDWQTRAVPFKVSALGPAPNGAISISTTPEPHQCLGPAGGPDATVTNTDTIEISSVPPLLDGAEVMAVDLTHPLGSGFTDEGDGSSEIEITVLNPIRFTYVQGGPGADHVRVGDDGVNLNADESGGPDVDVSYAFSTDGGNGSSNVWMWGNAGNDDLSNAGGAGTGFERSPEQYGGIVDGGPGDDVLVQSAEQGRVRGGPGADVITGDEWHITSSTTVALYDDATGGVTVDLGNTAQQAIGGGLGNDTINANIQNVVGGDFDDEFTSSNSHRNEFFGGHGNDQFFGGDDFDHLHGQNGDDVLYGGGHIDILYGEEGDDSLDGEGGNDWLIADPPGGHPGSDTLQGGPGDDDLEGGAGSDALEGGEGDDRLDPGGAEMDTADGGVGTDLINYGPQAGGGPTTGVVVDLEVVEPQNTRGGGLDTLVGFEDVEGTQFTDDLFGTDGPNHMSGGDPAGGDNSTGADYIDGAGGDDYLVTSWGNSSPVALWGGEGNDLIVGGSGPDELSGEGGDDRLESGGGNDVLFGDEGDDLLDSAGDSDYLAGGPGNDSLQAGWGDDDLAGGPGADLLEAASGDDGLDPGGEEADTLSGGEGEDFLHYAPESSGGPATGVDVDLALAGEQDTRGGGPDTIGGIEHMEGTRFTDHLFGTDGLNIISGGVPDPATHSSGSDRIEGRSGDDLLVTDEGSVDPVVLAGGEGGDLLSSGASDDRLLGDGGDDALFSGAGADYLEAGPGKDGFYAGSGSDRLIATDGERDELDCGPDPDQTSFDQGIDVLNNECEVQKDVAPAAGTGPPPPAVKNTGTPAPFVAAKVIKLPANHRGRKRCLRARRIKVTIVQPNGVQISRVRVFVNGREVARALNGKWTSGFKLRLQRRKSIVKVKVDGADGRSITASRVYRRCAKKKR